MPTALIDHRGAQLLGQLLHVNVQVQRYPSRAESLQALRSGEVDLLGTANGFGFHTVAKNVSVWRIGTVVPWSLVVNQAALKLKQAPIRAIIDAFAGAIVK